METTLNKNYIGLGEKETKNLATELNQLLADYHVFYQNLRAAHWNIKGENFFTLHEKFEELYNNAKENVDEVAERVLTLGYVPIHKLKDILAESNIVEVDTTGNDKELVSTLLDNFKTLLTQERKVLELASGAGDEATVDLMTGYISAQEKICWMLAAFLK
ncbi:Dps family protein [Luteibaculum oceani]|uniref:DNA starvation/stationary phase protection protein n=1 Tax=Luteibaculum oceani TaxID=1294296 RepID=A0A5C6UTB9_9FLAO|nr:Dps family protein [Luteibaculum oceani]TXC76219.1 DNA starvation/stationary phase protection protein [Luteibaculum oceani]